MVSFAVGGCVGDLARLLGVRGGRWDVAGLLDARLLNAWGLRRRGVCRALEPGRLV